MSEHSANRANSGLAGAARVPEALRSIDGRVGDYLFLGARRGTTGDGRIVSAAIEEQTAQVLKNVEAALERHGFEFRDIVKTRYFLARKGEYEAMHSVRVPFYQQRFPSGDYPTSTALFVEPDEDGILIELEAFACKKRKPYDTEDVCKYPPAPLLAMAPLWSLGIDTGELLFLNGIPGIAPDRELVGSAKAPRDRTKLQTYQSLENIRIMAEKGGYEFSDVIKLTAYLADPAEYEAMVETYNEYVERRTPRDAHPIFTVVHAGFPQEQMRLEIEAFAARGPRTSILDGDRARTVVASRALRVGNWVVGSNEAVPHFTEGSDPWADVGATLSSVAAGVGDLVHVTVWAGEGQDEAGVYRGLELERDIGSVTIGRAGIIGELTESGLEIIAYSPEADSAAA